VGSLGELLVGPVDLPCLRLEVLLHFWAQVRDMVRVVLQLALLIRGIDVLLGGVSRHSENGVGIEDLLSLPSLLWLRRLLRLSRVLLGLKRFLLRQASFPFFFLFLKRFLPVLLSPLFFLFTFFLCLRPLLIRACQGRTPHGLCGFMPAFLAKVARFRNVAAAPTSAGHVARLHGKVLRGRRYQG